MNDVEIMVAKDSLLDLSRGGGLGSFLQTVLDFEVLY